MAYTVPARHRKSAGPAQPGAAASRHGRPIRSRARVRKAILRASTVVLTPTILVAGALAIAIHVSARTPASARDLPSAVVEAGAVMSGPKVTNLLRSLQTKSATTAPATTAPSTGSSAPPAAAPPTGYLNPLRAVTGLIPQRIDMGVDFVATGPVYAIGDAIVTNAQGDNGGWPGGGWITYQLTDGPAAGLMVYVAEEITPAVQVGEHVTAATVVGYMNGDSEGIETGWAMADGASAESQLAEAGAIGGNGPFPTQVGISFDALLVALGVPAAPNLGQQAFGLLPPNYSVPWAQVVS